MLWQRFWLDLCTEQVVSAKAWANQFLPCSSSGIALFGMRTVQADSCLNSEQIDTRFISVGGQEGGWGGGGAFLAGDPNFTRVCQESFFFTPPGGTSVEVHIRGLAHYLQANNAFACQWCVIPPICTSTTSTQVETQSRLWFFLPQRVPSACRKSSHLPIWNIESLKVPFCGREVIYTRWQLIWAYDWLCYTFVLPIWRHLFL